MRQRIVVVGASLAGLRAAETLRDRGFDGELTLIGEEPHLPYDRPPLSKQVLQGTWEPDQTFFRKKEGYDALALDMRLGVRAMSVDPRAKRVTLAGGTFADYDRLIIATGARVRTLPGIAPRSGLLVLRGLDDAIALRRELMHATHVAIVGAGFIGLEVAASCRARGLHVTVIESSSAPLSPVLGPALCEMIAAMHRDHGVDLRTGVAVTDVFGPESRVAGVALSDGSRIAADVVVVGIGVTPNTEWLEGSGLTLDNGIVCNGSGEAAPGVYAAGDVARVANRWHGDSPRIEHWTNAVEQAVHAAENALAGPAAGTSFSSVPYFWSDQYRPQNPVHRSRTSARRDRDRRRVARRPTADGALPAGRSRGGVSRRESTACADQIQEAARRRRHVGFRSLGNGGFVTHIPRIDELLPRDFYSSTDDGVLVRVGSPLICYSLPVAFPAVGGNDENRATMAVMLSCPPRSFASDIRRVHAASGSGSPRKTSLISACDSISVRPSEHSKSSSSTRSSRL